MWAGGAEPEEWQDAIDEAWWYRVSSFCTAIRVSCSYAARAALPRRAAALRLVSVPAHGRVGRAQRLSHGRRRHVGPAVAVETADRVLATTNTLVTSSLIPFGVLGLMHFPLASVVVLAVGIVAALLCKRRATISAATNRREYLIFHSLWHLILPAAATIAQLLLEWNFAQDSREPEGIGVRSFRMLVSD